MAKNETLAHDARITIEQLIDDIRTTIENYDYEIFEYAMENEPIDNGEIFEDEEDDDDDEEKMTIGNMLYSIEHQLEQLKNYI